MHSKSSEVLVRSHRSPTSGNTKALVSNANHDSMRWRKTLGKTKRNISQAAERVQNATRQNCARWQKLSVDSKTTCRRSVLVGVVISVANNIVLSQCLLPCKSKALLGSSNSMMLSSLLRSLLLLGLVTFSKQQYTGCVDPSDPTALVTIGEKTTVCLQIGNSLDWSSGVQYTRVSFQPEADKYTRFHLPNCK